MTEQIAQPALDSGDDDPFNYARHRLAPEINAPLARFAGAEPPAPEWFKAAIADAPERTFVESQGTKVELLTWGEIGRPGLLLIHGNGAHADWWSFIAPLLARHYRVAALSLAGMGASEWRDHYSAQAFARDAEACARAAGLYADGRAPVYIGHSYGGSQAYQSAVQSPAQMRALIVVDSVFGPVERIIAQKRADPPAARIYPTLAEGLARFRLAPPQPAENLFIVDYIARHALKPVPLADGSGEGWSWRFDPAIWIKTDLTQNAPPRQPVSCTPVPIIHFYGADTHVLKVRAAGDDLQPRGLTEIEIPNAYHHVLIDQPLALVAAIRAALTLWAA